MPVIRAQVRIPYYTAIPQDIISNTFHYFWDGVVGFEDVCNYLTGRLQAFYNTAYQTSGWAAWTRAESSQVNWYDLSTPEPRVPYTVNLTLTANRATTTLLAPEAAIVLSYQGARVAGIPQARRRGRLYMGGLADAWSTAATTTSFPTPNAGRVTNLITGFTTSVVNTADAGLQFVVYSPTSNATALPVNGWVDNAFDTQRRRGNRATARTLWSI